MAIPFLMDFVCVFVCVCAWASDDRKKKQNKDNKGGTAQL